LEGKYQDLNKIIQAYNEAIAKREELFKRLMEIDLAGSTDEVQDPKLILNSMFMTKHQFFEEVEILKGLSTGKFYGIVEYNEEEINNWLVDYFMKNQDIEEEIHEIYHDLRDLEDELFNIKIKDEINVSPMNN
jgi:hypothetical protein